MAHCKNYNHDKENADKYQKLENLKARMMKFCAAVKKDSLKEKRKNTCGFADEECEGSDDNQCETKEDIKLAPNLLFVTEIEPLSEQEFKSVPSYMKGQIKLEKLNSSIKILNKVCLNKYELMATPKSKRSFQIQTKINQYMRQEVPETKDSNFIVDDDVISFSSLKIDKAFLKSIVILRHCKRIKEVRATKLNRYVFL